MIKEDFIELESQIKEIFSCNHIYGYYGENNQWIFFNNTKGDNMEIYFLSFPIHRLMYLTPLPANVSLRVQNPFKSLIHLLGCHRSKRWNMYNYDLMINTCIYQLLKRNEEIKIPHFLQEAIDIMTMETGLISIASQFQMDKWGAIALYDPALKKVYTIASSKSMADGQVGHMLRTYTGGREYQLNSKRAFTEGDYTAILEYLQKYRAKIYNKLHPDEELV